MNIRALLIATAICLFPLSARAVCTASGNATSSSADILTANDLTGVEGRHFLLVQNTGTTNPMNVAIGTSNNATASDIYLGPGGSLLMTMQALKLVPAGDVAVISAAGTTYSVCDW